MGAMGVLTKPVKTREPLDETFTRIKQNIEPRHRRRRAVSSRMKPARNEIGELISAEDIIVHYFSTGGDALVALEQGNFDAAILPIDLPDTRGFDLVDEIRERAKLADLPILFCSNRQLSKRKNCT
jgi:CheY-like chemotaxis protein